MVRNSLYSVRGFNPGARDLENCMRGGETVQQVSSQDDGRNQKNVHKKKEGFTKRGQMRNHMV